MLGHAVNTRTALLVLVLCCSRSSTALDGDARSTVGAAAAARQASSAHACQNVLFVNFQGDQQIRFALSRDGFHYTPLLNNTVVPGFTDDNEVTSLRDPYLNWDPKSQLYRMVATDGHKFGHDAQIWYWESKDLLTWTKQRGLPVMELYEGQFQDTWAPEWIWDRAAEEYVVFWTTRWLPNVTQPHFDPSCTNKNPARFAQWHTRTKDWQTFTPPSVLIDMHCMVEAVAPMALGDGGYDCDIVYNEADSLYHAYFKSMQAPTLKIDGKPWSDSNVQPWSGVHTVSSPDLKNWSLPLPRPQGSSPEMLGMWGAEGPEILIVNDTMHLYFDCSFQPFDKSKWPRPPYGVATAPYPQGYTDIASWRTIPGSCTGNNTANMLFPTGATQGSFICVNNSQYDAILAKWPA